MKKILVIEDDLKHLEDAKKFFEALEGEFEITYASDYESGCELYYDEEKEEFDVNGLKKYDGVISDIFFPRNKRDKATEPVGVSVMMQCYMLKIPCILNTAGYHHGIRYQWISDLQIRMFLPAMVDASSDYGFEEANQKNWQRAFENLLELLNKN